MRRFYSEALRIPESEIQSDDFGEIIDKIGALQQKYPITKGHLDARDICNRLMRKENYLVALLNKEVFNVENPITVKPTSTLTKTLEWNLSFCVVNYFFDDAGHIRHTLLKEMHKDKLGEELKRRFIAVGVANLILCPFIFLMLLAYFLFKYGEEVYRSPKTIATRQYTTAARWRLREFNELSYLFDRRLNNSRSKATKYMEQFGRTRWTPIARLVAFVAGSFAVVFLALSIANEDLLMHFEITPGKSIIWYLGLMGAVLAISRAFIPDAMRAHDPSKLMEAIAEHTHYLPKHWRNRLHTENIHREFSQLYNYKFSILLHELISVLTTPFILIFALPRCADRVVEFFRDFTVHVDGLGHVCSFALFDFERHGNPKYGGALGQLEVDRRNLTKQGKMEKSFLSFVSNNPKWVPHELGSQFLDRIEDFDRTPLNGPSMAVRTRLPPVPNVFRRSPLSRPTLTLDERQEEEQVHGSSLFPTTAKEAAEPTGLMSIINKYYNR